MAGFTRVPRVGVLLAALGAAAGAGCGAQPAAGPRHTPPARASASIRGVLAVGAPATQLGTPALGGRSREPAFTLQALHTPGADPRDVCVRIGLAIDLADADRRCAVRAAGTGASFVYEPGVLDRLGGEPTVVAGVAPPGFNRVELSGPGGQRALPLSDEGAFLAVYAHGVRGRARLVAERGGGGPSTTIRRFSLPLRGRAIYGADHAQRRRGAVFDDEVGEAILQRSYAGILRRFGPPAARTFGHRRCLYYEVVGEPRHRGWRFCFNAAGRMISAGGNGRFPA